MSAESVAEPSVRPSGAQAVVRRLPSPYRAMLAICSDLDETPDREVYGDIARFVNTTGQTGLGRGIGLEVGNSVYFDMPAGQFSYWNTDDAGRAMLRALIQSGHVDCLHSYGDFATHRRHAGRALDELVRHGCRLKVWVDHAQAPSNFGADIMRGSGDVRSADVYHADLTCDYGITFVWRGRVTSVVGQNVPRQLGGVYDRHHPAASLKTVAKEFAKGVLARRGNAKYGMHTDNAILRPAVLRDGRSVVEFLRANPSWRGVDLSATAAGLGEVITPRMLDTLVSREGVSILYTHLGRTTRRGEPFPRHSREALATLAGYQQDGRILVTTTRRLLEYWTMVPAVRVTQTLEDDVERVGVHSEATGSALDGLSIYVRSAARARLFVNGRERPDVRRHPADHTGRESVSVPWSRLEFPQL